MTLLVPWLVYPAVLTVLALGLGLLVEQVSGKSLRLELRLPAGLALMVVVGLFTTMVSATARLTVPVVVGLATVGLLRAARSRPTLDWRLVALAVGVFAVYAAPVVLTGQATFTGYVKLDDTASFLGFTDQMMSHGRDLSGLAPSTYQIMLHLNIGEGYPIGTFVPLGVGSELTGQDPAWLFQPCMAYYAAMGALALYALLKGLVRSRGLRAVAAFVAAQAALLFAYSLWGGIKEVAATATIALAAALVPLDRDDLSGSRALLPFAVAAAATLGVLSVSGIIWVGLLALPALVLLVRSPRRVWRVAGLVVVSVCLLSIPSLVIARQFLHYTTSNLLTHAERFGNLIRPLKLIQIAGIWPSADFRVDPHDYPVTLILIGVCLLAAAWGALQAVRCRAFRLPLVVAVCAVAAVALDIHSSPWLTGKALATGSPFVVLLALAGAALLLESGRRVEGVVVAAVIAAGVLWSNVLGYGAVWIAPRAQLAELETIGRLYADEGPALMTEYQPYGVRHFLRKLDAEGSSELRVHQVPLADGSLVPPGQYADIDQYRYPDLLFYRTLVLRRSPVQSRPGAPWSLVWEGRYYDVWQRPESGGRTVIEHIPLGSQLGASAVPGCAAVKAAAALAARDGGELAAARTPDPVFVSLTGGTHPAAWSSNPADPTTITPTAPGTIETTVSVPSAGDYSAWINGTLLRRVTLAIDGKPVGGVNTSGSLYAPLGTVRLTSGAHTVTLRFGTPWLEPGSTAPIYPIGPLALTPAGGPSPVEYVRPARAASLCGQALDWVEVVSR